MAFGNESFGLRQVKIKQGATLVTLQAAQTLSCTPRSIVSELKGAFKIIAVSTIVEALEWSLENGGIQLDALALMTGWTAVASGSTPNQTNTLTAHAGTAFPYFTIYGKVLGSGLDDLHVKIFRAKIMSVEGEFQGGEFHVDRISGIAIKDGTRGLFELVQNETAAALPLSAPISLTATALSEIEIDLAWTLAGSGVTHFQIERSLEGSTFNQIAVVTVANTTYRDTGLTPATRYWYRVRAVNATLVSGYSNIADATTPEHIPVVEEVWFATVDAIYWSGDYFLGGQPTWNKVTGLPNGNPIVWMGLPADGSMLYLVTATNYRTIYRCANPKAATPTWDAILTEGTSVSGGVVTEYFGYVMGPYVISGNKLITTAHKNNAPIWIYGEYAGSAWAWSAMGNQGMFSPTGVGFDTWLAALTGAESADVYSKNAALLESESLNGYEIWHRAGLPRYGMRWIDSNLYLRTVGGAIDQLLGHSDWVSQIQSSKITGAENGVHVYCVADLESDHTVGYLWAAADGVSFAKIADWVPGRVLDANYIGGGSLFWLPQTVLANTVLSRLYTQAGAVLTDVDGNSDRTGNFWSLASGDQTIVGSGLVYE
jgi:hypothetical protein